MGEDNAEEGPKHTAKDAALLKQFEEEFAKNKDNLKNGPVSNRSTTDIVPCGIFLIFMVGMVVVFAYGLMYGQPSNITVGWDGDQRGCGVETNSMTKDYPYLYWATAPTEEQFNELTTGDTSSILDLLELGTCVKECPSMSSTIECVPTMGMTVAGSNCNMDGDPCVCDIVKDVDGTTVNVAFRYDTVAAGFPGSGFCVPMITDETNEDVVSVITEMKEKFQASDSGQLVQSWVKDIINSWSVIAISSVTALILGYLYLFVIRCIGGTIIWVSIAVIILSLLASAGYTWHYKTIHYTPDESIYDYMTWTTYGLLGLCGIVLLLVCCCYQAIKIGIAVFKTTAQYVQANLRIFALPISSYLLIALWSCFWIIGAIMVFSIGTPESRGWPYKFLTEVKWTTTNRWIFFYDVFGLFWVNAFLIGLSQFIIGASACIWYFECNSDTKGSGTVGRGFYWAYRYHLGSIAFGSFIIAVCQMMRFLFDYYRRKIGLAAQTPFVKTLLCITGYLLWLLDNCVKFISKNAYIQVALTNNHFFKSAWNGFALIVKNVHRFGAAKSIGAIYMLFGGLMITTTNGLLGYLFLTNFEYVVVDSPIPPVIVICIISMKIAMTFLSIFSFSSDAILQSFLLDEELRFQGSDRPEYMQEFAEELKKRGKGCCG